MSTKSGGGETFSPSRVLTFGLRFEPKAVPTGHRPDGTPSQKLRKIYGLVKNFSSSLFRRWTALNDPPFSAPHLALHPALPGSDRQYNRRRLGGCQQR